MMKIKYLKTDSPLRLKFILSNSYFEFANSLRRAMIAEVPVMAIEEVNISANNSALYDEVIALRFGLIPLKTDLKNYNLRSKCKCRKGCPKCTVKLTLDKTGPCTVYSSDLKSSDHKVVPAINDLPVIKLFENQSIKIEAIAELGFGKEHAKWTPCAATYRYYPQINVLKNCLKAVSVCPKKVFEFKNRKLLIKDLDACDLCLACVEACPKDALRVKGDDSKFIFSIESWGQHNPKALVKLGLQALKAKVDEFSKAL